MHSLLTGPLTTERVTVAIRDLPADLQDTSLVQLSDFHFDGYSLSRDLLMAAIAQCNALQPDLVVLTGDFITKGTQYIEELADYLRQLESRVGTYAILGNHDASRHRFRRAVQAALTASDIGVLWNEIAYPLGAGLPLVGLADFYSHDCQPVSLLAQLDPAVPRVVLAHNPDTLDLLHQSRADLVLSGHTHGGQVNIPGVGILPKYLNEAATRVPCWSRKFIPFLNQDCDRVFHHWEWASGLHTVGDSQLYVNRGLGSYFPGRLFCPPELTVITLIATDTRPE